MDVRSWSSRKTTKYPLWWQYTPPFITDIHLQLHSNLMANLWRAPCTPGKLSTVRIRYNNGKVMRRSKFRVFLHPQRLTLWGGCLCRCTLISPLIKWRHWVSDPKSQYFTCKTVWASCSIKANQKFLIIQPASEISGLYSCAQKGQHQGNCFNSLLNISASEFCMVSTDCARGIHLSGHAC